MKYFFSKFKSLLKIKLIDKITILIFFLVIGISIFFFLRKSEYIYVTLNLFYNPNYQWDMIEMPTPLFINKLQAGINEKDIFGRENIKIENVYRYDTSYYIGIVESYVTLKVKSVYNKQNQKYTYDGLPLSIGEYTKFTIQNLQINGIIQSISKTIPETKKITYLVKGFLDPKNNKNYQNEMIFTDLFSSDGIPKYISNKIYENDTITDSNGENITIIKKIIKQPATYKTIVNDQVAYIPDTEQEKIDLEIEVLATIINSEPFYKQKKPLKVGTILELNFKNTRLYLTITDIEQIL